VARNGSTRHCRPAAQVLCTSSRSKRLALGDQLAAELFAAPIWKRPPSFGHARACFTRKVRPPPQPEFRAICGKVHRRDGDEPKGRKGTLTSGGAGRKPPWRGDSAGRRGRLGGPRSGGHEKNRLGVCRTELPTKAQRAAE